MPRGRAMSPISPRKDGAPPTQMSATRHLTLSPTRKRSVSELTNLLAPSHSRSSPWETTWTCVGARKYSSDTYPRDCAVNNSREGSEAYGGGFEHPPKPPDARGEGGSCTLPSLVVAMCLCITSILARAAMTPSIVVKGITAAIVTRLGCCSPPECRHPPTPSSRSTAGAAIKSASRRRRCLSPFYSPLKRWLSPQAFARRRMWSGSGGGGVY